MYGTSIADQDDCDEFAAENVDYATCRCVLLKQLLYLAFGDGDPDGGLGVLDDLAVLKLDLPVQLLDL